ncbi:MAG: hypothetical protein ACLVKO_10900 [Dysgonomonas sp.]
MKNKFYLLICLFAICSSSVNAQGKKKFDYEDFKQKKYNYLVKEIGLTDKETKDFLPLTDELMQKKYELNKELRIEIRALRKKKNISDSEYNAINEKVLDTRIKEATLEKEYYQKFKKSSFSRKDIQVPACREGFYEKGCKKKNTNILTIN